MQRGKKYRRAVISLVVGLPLGLGPCLDAQQASAQTAPSCQAGYYYASDGYCYPAQPPVYAAPPPVYDASPPVYQPAPIVDGLAIGVGVGLLFGALAGGQSRRGDDHNRSRDVHNAHGGGDHGRH